jgi:glycosyltransferase involved in cell wall biosynthesis
VPKVLIVQEHLPHYRQRFFELLHESLTQKGIELNLVYSPNTAANLLAGSLPWATPIPVRRRGSFAWQDVRALAEQADLVIVQQEAKYLANYFLGIRSIFSEMKFAYWGHGKNFQGDNASIVGERLKSFSSRFCDWWFAYNDLSAHIVESLGFPRERITAVQNSIDTRTISDAGRAISSQELAALRNSMGIRSENVGVFTGGLYNEKRLKFLLDSCFLVRETIPDFELIIIGKGPDANFIREQAEKNSWIHYVGAKNDIEKVPYWKLAKLLLMPGLVGLVVLDSFALGVPMVTTDYPNHSPEISYLKDGENGVVVSPWTDATCYARRVVELLQTPAEIECLRHKAMEAANQYSVQNMVENFVVGVEAALAAPHLPRRQQLSRKIRLPLTREGLPRMAVIIRSLAPYFRDFYDSMAASCRTDQLKILIGQPGTDWINPWDAGLIRLQRADHTFVNSRVLERKRKIILPSHELLKELEKIRPSLILTHEYSPLSLFAGLWSLLQGVPWIIATDIGPDYRAPYPPLSLGQKLLHRIANHFCGGILALTPSAVKRATSLGKPHLLAPHAIDTGCYRPPDRRVPSAENIQIIAVGNFIHRKGYDLLFKALASLDCSKSSPWSLACYGAGSTAKLGDLAETLEISSRVRFSSFLGVSELIQAYQTADLFVLATRSDTYGIVVHEAAACGLPIIVSKYAGAAEVLVEEGSNGHVIDPEDTAKFADRLAELLKDSSRREAFGRRSREIAIKWDVKNNAARTFCWLSKLVEPPLERRHLWKKTL